MRDNEDAATVLEAAILGSFEGLANLVYRGPWVQSSLMGSMKIIILAWDKVQATMTPGIQLVSLSTLLCFNPKLSHFSDIPDPIIWAGVGIKRLQDVVEGGKLSSAQDQISVAKLVSV